ncbi:hypothetical protein GW17_00004893 [Ensete ventricosum]|nr:hypothetical protein GW17_00004893 [Ensete ventricosum]
MERHMPCRRLAGRHIDSDRNRPSVVDFDRRNQLREKEEEEGEEGEKYLVRVALPRFPRAVRRPRDPSPTGDFFSLCGEKEQSDSRVAERHFLDLSKKYGSVLAVDLVNTLKSASCSRYVHFDFHQICGHIHFERLSLLYNQIEDYLNKHGYAVCLAIF